MSIKSLFSVRDVTKGRPWKRLVELAVPLLIGNVVQQLYSTVDTIVVGRYVGDEALSAVGATTSVVHLMYVLFIGLAVGAGILVSQRFGARDREGLSRVISNVLILMCIVSVISTVLSLTLAIAPVFGGKTLLNLLNVPEGNIYDWAQLYLIVIFSGITATIFYNLISGILRGLGDSVTALVFLVITCVLNTVLDVWFVAGLGMGVFGAALATIISQAISAVLCVLKLLRMSDVFDLNRSTLKPNKEIMGRVVSLGLPGAITQGIFSMSVMLVQSLLNSMGPTVMAANIVVMRVDGFAVLPFFSIGNAMTTYTGQNFGAKKLERLETGSRQALIMAFCTSVVLTSLILLFGRALAGLFTQTQEIIDLAMTALRILAVGYMVNSLNHAMQGYLRGTGDTKTPMWITIFGQVILRLPLAYAAARLTANEQWPNGQLYGVNLSMVITWVISTILVFFVFRRRQRYLRANADESWQLSHEG